MHRKWQRVRYHKAKRALNCIWPVILLFVNTDDDVKINLPRK